MKIFGIEIRFSRAAKPLPEWGVNLMSTVALNCQRLDDLEQGVDEVRRKSAATERKVYRTEEKETSGGNGEGQVNQVVAGIASLSPGDPVPPELFAAINQG